MKIFILVFYVNREIIVRYIYVCFLGNNFYYFSIFIISGIILLISRNYDLIKFNS